MAEVGVPVVFNTLPDVQNDAIEVGLPKLILRDTETSRLLGNADRSSPSKTFKILNAEMKFKILFLNKKIFKKNRGSAVSVLYVSCVVWAQVVCVVSLSPEGFASK